MRTPAILQMESVECGAAALGMVLGYYGRHIPLPELRRDCGVSREGSKASHLLKAARDHGLIASGVRCDIPALEEMTLPAILFWNFNHFVVLEGRSRDGRHFSLNDPACGHRRVTAEEFSAAFTGVVLRFAPGPGFEKRPPAGKLSAQFREVITRDPGLWGFVVLCAFFLIVPTLATAALIKIFVDDFLIGGITRWLLPIIAGLGLAALMQGTLVALQHNALRRWQAWRGGTDSPGFFRQLLEAPLSWHSGRALGDVAGRCLLPYDTTREIATRVAPALLNLLPIAGALAMMVVIDSTLAGLALLIVGLAGLLTWREVNTRSGDLRQLAHLEGRFDSAAFHGLSIAEHLKCGGAAGFLTRLEEIQTRIRYLSQHIQVSTHAALTGLFLLSACGFAALVVWGAFRVLDQKLTVGGLTAFLILWLQVRLLLKGWPELPETLQRFQAGTVRLGDVPAPAAAGVEAEGSGFQSLQTTNLAFGYSQFSEPVLEDISFRLEPGRMLVLTGASGSGKSTLVKVLTGILTPWAGEVVLNNRPLTSRALASCAGVIEQDIVFFGGPVEENLSLGNSSAELGAAIRSAGLEEILASRAGEELLENAVNFSGGQRQRLEIARVLARNPGLVILDEALGGLEAGAADAILDDIQRRNCAVFLVTHRPEIMRRADEILVLAGGRIVERGGFEELSRTAPVFRELLKP